MNLRKVTLSVLFALVIVSLHGCGTARRAGKDLGIVVTSPAIVLYAGGTDAYTSAVEIEKGLGGGAVTQVLFMPFAFIVHGIKHAFYAVVHAADFVMTPIWGWAELSEFAPEVEPLDYYTGTIFDTAESDSSSVDAESGEAR